MKKLALFAMGLLIAGSAFAADHPQKPGKWQIKMQMEIPGMPMKMPPVNTEVCLTEEDIANPQKAVPNDPKSDCKVGDYKVAGNKVTWTIDCPKQKMKGEGEITYSGDSYSGAMNMNVDGQAMAIKYSGKHLGECKK